MAGAARADVGPAAARGSLRAWIAAADPPLILVVVLQAAYGLGVAHQLHPLSPWRVAATIVLFVCDGAGRRLINDYEDHVRGLDSVQDVRPDRPLALGLDMRRVRAVGLATFVVAWVIAAVLAVTTNPWLLVLVAVSYGAYFAYAGGPRPLGHRGYGEALDFTITGTLVTLLVIWVNAGEVTGAAVVGALGPACLFAALMLHNNARDVDKDAAAGKVTLPQVVGLVPTKVLYALLLAGFSAVVVAQALLFDAPWLLLPLLTLPWTAALAARVLRAPRLGATMVSWAWLFLIMIADFALFTLGSWL